MPESDYILNIKGLSNFYYNNSSNIFMKRETVNVLKDISFDIRKGEIFGLVGESGCGKSTLGRAIVGLVDVQGEIFIDGEKIEGKRPKKLSRKIQIVFQNPLSSLNPKKKIGWILEEPLKIHKVGDKQGRVRRVDEVLELIGLGSSYRSRYPHELSGGQRQRISIGCALMLNPKLIIADEPVSALDVSVQSQILNLMKDLHNRLNISYLFISHNLNVVYYLCDRVAVMYLGYIVELADVEDIYDFPMHPYTQALLSAISGMSGEKADSLIRVDGEVKHMDAVSKGCVFNPRCPKAFEKCTREIPGLKCINSRNGKEHFVRCHFIMKE